MEKKMKPSRLNKGFTLIELMIVAAIIAICLAIAQPMFQRWNMTDLERRQYDLQQAREREQWGREASKWQTTCIGGYQFTYNRYDHEGRPPVQILDQNAAGLPCQ
ncbi:hypothetical protein [Xanthomonas phage JGB6]|nr:hypothetical protein [Xanthomonas phage JGB6]